MGAGSILKDYLSDHDIKHKQLAADLNISPSTLSGYLTDKRNIPEDVLIQIANHLEVTTDYLHGLTRNPLRPVRPSEEEERLLLDYRAMTEEHRALARQIIALLR